jgi:uncharacterized cupredoxin-like copper-binding protein
MKLWHGLLIGVALLLAACNAKANTLDVEMNDFSFTPNPMTVKAGELVTLNLTNNGTLEHDFLILEQGEQGHAPFKEADARIYWKAHLGARQEQVLQFTAPSEPGEYTVVCGIPGHLEQNMQAILIVTP